MTDLANTPFAALRDVPPVVARAGDGLKSIATEKAEKGKTMSRSARRKRVALVFPASVSWLAVLADGVAQYARQHGGWDFTTSPSLPTLGEAGETGLNAYSLRHWPGDGAIAILNTPAEAVAARRLGIPVVSIGGSVADCGLPCVMLDYYAAGRLAAEHLLDRGLRRLAYHGFAAMWSSEERRRGFADRAAKAGVPCDVYEMAPVRDPRSTWPQRRAALDLWLKTLQPPVGVLAVHDYRARVTLDECLRLGLDVPNDVAVLGVDNDLTVCEFCQPTLSSVSRSPWKNGYAAAQLLDQLMAGQPAPAETVRIPPDGIVARQSTDTIAVEDPHVRAAVQFMRDNLGEVFGIERVTKQVPVSRRRLHEQFQRLLHRTPYQYLCNLRVERAKQLLAVPQVVNMQKIARQCGFPSAARLRLVFQRVAGMLPLAYHRIYGGVAATKAPRRGKGAGTGSF
ncbi:MAG: XylR family transcriptional regulator [Thermoguttaceae bacterium]